MWLDCHATSEIGSSELNKIPAFVKISSNQRNGNDNRQKSGVDSFSAIYFPIVANNQVFCCAFEVKGLASLVEDSTFSPFWFNCTIYLDYTITFQKMSAL